MSKELISLREMFQVSAIRQRQPDGTPWVTAIGTVAGCLGLLASFHPEQPIPGQERLIFGGISAALLFLTLGYELKRRSQ